MKAKSYWPIILLLVIAFVSHHIWFDNASILTFGDWGFFYPETQKELFAFPSLWTSFGFGSPDIGLSMYPINILWGLLSRWTSFAVSERILYFWPSIILVVINSYLLVKKITKSNLASFIGSLIYTYNIYFMIGRTGHLTLMTTFALSPLILYLQIKLFEERKLHTAVIMGLLMSLASYYEFRAFYILFWVMVLYALFLSFTSYLSKGKLLKIYLLSLISFAIVGFLNSYWLIGLLKVGKLTTNEIFSRPLFGNEFINILNAFTLWIPWWTNAKLTVFTVQPIPFYEWFIAFFGFLGLIFSKNKHVLFFGFILILGLLLGKQSGIPFSNFYLWLYSHFPGFNAFREASKFYALIALGYSVLLAAFTDEVWRNKSKFLGNKVVKVTIISIIALLFLVNTKPLLTQEIGSLFVTRQVPQDYIRLNKTILQEENYFRTLWIPIDSRWSLYTNNHPKLRLITLINADWSSFIQGTHLEKDSIPAETMTGFMKLPDAHQLFNEASIRYVIIPLEDKANDDNFFPDYGKNRQFYINQLNKVSYLHKISGGAKDLVIYENRDYRPHLYATADKETIHSFQPLFCTVVYKFINPSKYTFLVKKAGGPFYLNFSEMYNPDWSLRVGDFHWMDALLDKNYFLLDKYHLKNNAAFNTYFINPQKICNEVRINGSRFDNGCIKNADGSYDISGTLYFKSQNYLNLGLIISGIALISIIIYLVNIGITLFRRKI